MNKIYVVYKFNSNYRLSERELVEAFASCEDAKKFCCTKNKHSRAYVYRVEAVAFREPSHEPA